MIPKAYIAAFTFSAMMHSFCLAIPWMSRAEQGRAPDYIFLQLESAAPSFTAKKAAIKDPSKTILPSQPSLSGSGAVPRPPAAPASVPAGTVSSKDLLSDPQKGKIFSAYFQTVKSRIQEVAERHKHYVLREQGKVELDFVLSRDGRIAALQAHPDTRAAGDPLLMSRALDIIRGSQPFQAFPADIKAEAISFNITLVFDG